jgi:hypothetical protein
MSGIKGMDKLTGTPLSAKCVAKVTRGDTGKVEIRTMAYWDISLNGATCTLTVVGPTGTRTQLTTTVGTTAATVNGRTYQPYFYASRTVTPTDFPVAGQYKVQLVAAFSSYTRVANYTILNIGNTL